MSAKATPTLIPTGLTDREAIADTLFRFLESADTTDATQRDALVDSCWTPDGTLYLPEISAGVSRPPIVGNEARKANLAAGVGGMMDTQHTASNLRIWIEGEKAKVVGKGIASHYVLGEGKVPEKKGYVVGTTWDCEMRRGGPGGWLIEEMTLRADWIDGDEGVLARAFGTAPGEKKEEE